MPVAAGRPSAHPRQRAADTQSIHGAAALAGLLPQPAPGAGAPPARPARDLRHAPAGSGLGTGRRAAAPRAAADDRPGGATGRQRAGARPGRRRSVGTARCAGGPVHAAVRVGRGRLRHRDHGVQGAMARRPAHAVGRVGGTPHHPGRCTHRHHHADLQ